MKKLNCELIAIEKITNEHEGHKYNHYRPKFKINGTIISSEGTLSKENLMYFFAIKDVSDFYALLIQPTLF